MKFYLSSYKIGKRSDRLKELVPRGKRLGFVPNALDYVEPEKRKENNERDMKDLADFGISVEMLDLKNYFGKTAKLKKKIDSLGGIWVRGGNTFVLRQAMKLSGLDEILKNMDRKNFLYGGYSAGICILASSLKPLQNVDDPKTKPYKEMKKAIWDGLGILNYMILPHYKSDHSESTDIDKEVKYCKKNKVPFKTLRDGEVIIIE
ncbi:Type 1 glutamine amidotransferase-like domain-containing protein [archaeon]|nr:Type 1 glutamine amidotransferase-like domain-containing protein [archaeon]